MLVECLQKTPPLRRVVRWAGGVRAEELVNRFIPFIGKGNSVLDIGCGTGNVCECLRNRGLKVTPLDVRNLSFVDDLSPVLYDGRSMPFPDVAFDVGLLITVLHHTPDPLAVLKEAARVCRRLVIIEDIFESAPQKYLTFVMDSLLNLEFSGHPHSNKSDRGWRDAFAALGLTVVHATYNRSVLVFRHATYVLDHDSEESGPHDDALIAAGGVDE